MKSRPLPLRNAVCIIVLLFTAVAPRMARATSPDYVVTTTTGASIVPGTTDIGNHCDDCSTAVALPFPVSFYDQMFDTANVSANGYIYFTSSTNCCGFCLP